MELIYVWINKSKNGIYQQQGINLSPEYNFKFEKIKKKWTLSENKLSNSSINIFKYNNIENVSSIVGKNGTGKTTLLNYLFRLNGIMPSDNSYSEGYEQLRVLEQSESLTLFIFKIQSEVIIYHNFKEGFDNQTQYKAINLYNLETISNYLQNKKDFLNITKIYITNSSYGGMLNDGFSSQKNLSGISLTPSGLNTISSTFYNNLFNISNGFYQSSIYREWRSIINKRKTTQDFQQICDVIYFYKLIKTQKIKSYAGKISTSIEISCQSPLVTLEHEFPELITNIDDLSYLGENFYSSYTTLSKVLKKTKLAKSQLIHNLYLNLILEFSLESNIIIPESINDVETWIKENINKSSKQIYFKNALIEISTLKAICDKTKIKENIVPINDSAYHDAYIFDLEANYETYYKFTEFVTDIFDKKCSFILRYLKINIPYMSSGERAFQNFFSWLNLVPQFDNISGTIPRELNDNILLLIDEIDLYLHPNWQKNFLVYLLEEIEQQFSKNKVQIILSTHSPLCLSDIPRENTIYLSKCNENNKTVVDDRESHIQTFGKDIYSLLNDAFYLENSTMGAYAKKYIDEIIYALKKIKSNPHDFTKDKYQALSKKIECIGNELLKGKLDLMLNECFSNTTLKLEMLKQQRDFLNNQIAELEKNND